MMKIAYGNREIHFTHFVDPRLKHAYITVDHQKGVILKSPPVDQAQAGRMVLKKAAWIIEKLKIVAQDPMAPHGDIVSGSRIPYLGRKYYTQVIKDAAVSTVQLTFNHSRFKILVPPTLPEVQTHIREKIIHFYRQKAIEKITPRLNYWMQITGLKPKNIKFRKLTKRWGSCTPNQVIILNIESVKLPFSLIDYIIVHELCHLMHSTHDSKFRREIAKYLPNCNELEIHLNQVKN